jgi:hypothetical protein
MSTESYPKTMGEFDEQFHSEDACREYLTGVRWPEGYRCPSCGHGCYWPVPGNLLECQSCGRQTSLTAGTVLHGTRKPLRMWFRAIWWVSTQKTGGSAKGLQRLLGLGSYQTAWAWLQKLRRAMVRVGREPLEGPVEVDDGFIGGEEEGVTGRKTFKKAKIVVAVEVPGADRREIGRVRLQVVEDFSSKSLGGFVIENVAAGSTVITDDWTGYSNLSRHGFRHEVHQAASARKAKAEVLPDVHVVISLLKHWLLGTHQGAVRPKHLQRYLDEFAFRHNRRKSRHVGKIFYRTLQGAAGTPATPYWQLVNRSAPDEPLPVVDT